MLHFHQAHPADAAMRRVNLTLPQRSLLVGGILTLFLVAGLGSLFGNVLASATPGYPNGSTSLISLSDPPYIANGVARTVTVTIRDINGNTPIMPVEAVTVQAFDGTWSMILNDPGVQIDDYVFTATLPGRVVPETVHIYAAINFYEGASYCGEPTPYFDVPFVVLSPANSVISSTPASVRAGQSGAIKVQLKDTASGNWTSSGGTVTLSTTAGTLSAVTDNGNGTYTATLTAPITIGSVTVSGKLNGVDIGHSAVVPIVAGPASAATSTMTANPATITADGWDSSEIIVQLKDAYGNSLTSGGDTVTLLTTAGDLGPVSDYGNGTYHAWLGATSTGTATITGRVNGADMAASRAVTLVANVPPTLTATGGSPTFTEGGSAVDLFSSVSVSTVEAWQWISGLSLTVGNVADGSSEILRIDGSDVSLTDGTSGATAINGLTYVVSVVGGTATVTLSDGWLDTASTETLVDNLTYRNTSGSPSTANRIVTLTSIKDCGGTAGGGADTTVLSIAATVQVAAVNDAPVVTTSGGTTAFVEGNNAASTPVAVDSGLTVSDADSTTLASATVAITGNFRSGEDALVFTNTSAVTYGDVSASYNAATGVLTLTSSGATATLTQWQAVLCAVTYTNASETPNTATRTVSFTANDGTTGSAASTKSVSVASVNDAPVVTTSGGTTAFIEGNNAVSTPVAVDSGVTAGDADSATLASATVAITGNFQPGQDALVFTNTNSATYGNVVGSYNSATGVLTLTSAGATATLAQWQAVLRAVTYTNASEAPITATRTISFTVSDGSTESAASTKSVSVASVNDAPVVTTSGGTTAFAEGKNAASTPVAVDSGVTVADTDSATLASATVAVTGNFWSAEDILAFTNTNAATYGNVSVSYNAATGVLTLTSLGATATLAQWQAVLRAVTYTNPSETPNTSTRTISFTVSDGSTDSAASTKSVSVASVNDAPVITAPATIGVTEDVASALTGISFTDADAGPGSVTATFAVSGGTLSATSGGGVTALGSGTASLSLTGSVANLNAFLSASNLSFLTVANATANVTLTVAINDDGNTGSGGAQTAETAVTLVVAGVNDAPVNQVPAAQTMVQDGTLTFNAGNGNRISVADVDADGNDLSVTLSVTHGTLTLASTSGLSFMVGTGTDDATLVFRGSLTNVNNALNGLAFVPTPGYSGAARLDLTTDDLGSSGSGGAKTDSDAVDVSITLPTPATAWVSSSSANGTYKVGDTLALTVTFNTPVTVAGGLPALPLETGGTDRNATYVGGSGSATLSFTYTVQAGDVSGDLEYTSTAALTPGGATIRNGDGVDADLSLPAVGSANSLSGQKDIVIDGLAPTVNSVTVPANGTYCAGQNLDFTVNYDEAVTVTGAPYVALVVGSSSVRASYVAGSGTTSVVFRYTAASGDLDADGITVGGALVRNGGSLMDAAGNSAGLTLNSVASTAAVLVDGVAPGAPVITGISSDTGTSSADGITADRTLIISGTAEAANIVTVYRGATPMGTTTANAVGNWSFDYSGFSLAEGDYTFTAIASDAVGNVSAASSGYAVTIDLTAPAVSSVSAPADGTYGIGQNLDFTVRYDENVVVTGAPHLELTIGSTPVQAAYHSGSGTDTLLFRYTIPGSLQGQGATVGGAIVPNGGSLVDAAGNSADVTLNNVPDTSGLSVITITVSPNTVATRAVVGRILSVTLDSADYDYVEILVNGVQYGPDHPVTGTSMNLDLPTEAGSYRITIRVYDFVGNHRDFDVLYNVRVQYVPGRGDGFGWEMWKN